MSKLNKLFNLESIDLSVGEIDRDKGIISGAKVIEEGPLNDSRPFEVDDLTLNQVVDFGNRPNNGIKVRLTHPVSNSMGLHLGRAKNFRRDGNAVRADIHLAKSASISPNGDLAGYVMTLAEEDSESLGMSLATHLDHIAMKKESGPGSVAPLRFSRMYAVDVVSEPAATRGGLFEVTPEEVSETEMSDEASVAQADPQVEVNAETTQVDPIGATAVEAALSRSSDHAEWIETFGSQGAVWFLEGKSLNSCYKESLVSTRDELKQALAKIEELQAQLENRGGATGEASPAEPVVELSEAQVREHEQAMRDMEARKHGVRPEIARAAAALASIGK